MPPLQYCGQEPPRFPPHPHCPGPAEGEPWPRLGREAGRGGRHSRTPPRGRRVSIPLWQGRYGQVTRWARSHLRRHQHELSLLSRSPLQPPSYGPVNKVHGGVSRLPSVSQLVGQPPAHGSAAGPNLGPMGESLRPGGPEGQARLRACLPSSEPLRAALGGGLLGQLWPPRSHPAWGGGPASDSPTHLWPGPGILNNHVHTLPANGEMSGSHGAQPMVSGAHCTPPPPYHADPSLVRYVVAPRPGHQHARPLASASSWLPVDWPQPGASPHVAGQSLCLGGSAIGGADGGRQNVGGGRPPGVGGPPKPGVPRRPCPG